MMIFTKLLIQQSSIGATTIRGSGLGLGLKRLSKSLDRPYYNSSNVVQFINPRFIRFNSNSTIVQNIPGEKKLTNDLKDRLPTFPLSKEGLPTLLPKPGVPIPGPNMPLSKMIQILKNKKNPELIYEAESHRLYFIICSCFALVFAFYAWNIASISFSLTWDIYKENVNQLPDIPRLVNLVAQSFLCCILTLLPIAVSLIFIMTPSRLIRRMWYLPGEVEHVKFIVHPIIPGRASPMITLPLNELYRAQKAKIFTGRGFYGTIDSLFFYFLRQKNNKIPWLVDRKGFFWGDGRIQDYLFGKETIDSAAQGLSYDDKIGILNQKRQLEEEKLKKKLGLGWRYKAQAKLFADDMKTISGMTKSKMLKDNKHKQLDESKKKTTNK
ncbi:hypothetical protein PACTADRAFT_48653 [Pachysolen tannophilus NRRL Y-2460]|uniref:Uncharacterized protein n=1 Tax=Pachysolen tannophilus NRRL Y-2460 TaxID=669874 RepID=A0A1E4TYM1_PACTA|nr:hypothetical protein PACTADRAFT_48653 [Pachysolen tannophilus NRRL Y-2460]